MFDFWKAARTLRFHTLTPVGQNQNLADHSWGVARILIELWPTSSIELVKAALDHDLVEVFTGDVPSTTKWENPFFADELNKVERRYAEKNGVSFPSLTNYESLQLAIADSLEFLRYSEHQVSLGNTTFQKALDNISNKLHELIPELTEEDQTAVVTLILLFTEY